MQDIKDDTLRRAFETYSLCHDAEITGIRIVGNLAGQGEQLQTIKSSLITVDETLIDTKQNINRLKGIHHRVVHSVRTKLHQRIFSKIMLHTTKKQHSLSPASLSPSERRHSSPKIIRQKNIPSTQSFVDGQIDETLYNIEHALHRLKGIAQDINDQLVGQVDILDDIHVHMTKSTISIAHQTSEVEKMISETK